MTNELKKQWDEFLSGDWQVAIPEEQGEYPCSDRLGNQAGRTLAVYLDPRSNRWTTNPTWNGYIWSKKLPPLPKPV